MCSCTSQCFSYLGCDVLSDSVYYLRCTTMYQSLILPTKWNVISKWLSGNMSSWECLNVSLQWVCTCACTYDCLLPYWGEYPFSLCDLMQLALIKSHLGAFDSKVPVSSLSNLSFARAQAKSKTSTAAVISILFLSEITSHKNTELKSPQSKQTSTLLWLNASVADFFSSAFPDIVCWYAGLTLQQKVQNNNLVQTCCLLQLRVSHLRF